MDQPVQNAKPPITIKRRTSIDQGDYGNVLVHILDYLATKEEEEAKPKPEPQDQPEEEGPEPEPRVTQQAFDQQVDAIMRRFKRLETPIEKAGLKPDNWVAFLQAQIDDALRRIQRLEDWLTGNVRPKQRLKQERPERLPGLKSTKPKTKPKAKSAKKPPAKKSKRR